jgi:2-polyprenyl-3-methyl-5-hydroxy-6-metoxy-1,4-benzoquinol methylase
MLTSHPMQPFAAEPTDHSLYDYTRARFDRADTARTYRARKNVATWRNRREWHCIQAALGPLAPGSRVLDLPCGSGRLLPFLTAKGWRVTAADASAHMLTVARAAYADSTGGAAERASVCFEQREVLDTGFPGRSFDAVICNRLLHHYPSASLRRAALRELARIALGPLVVSYFSSRSLAALRFHLRHTLRGERPLDRVPVWPGDFARDVAAAGLRCTASHAVRRGLSAQTYLRLERV